MRSVCWSLPLGNLPSMGISDAAVLGSLIYDYPESSFLEYTEAHVDNWWRYLLSIGLLAELDLYISHK